MAGNVAGHDRVVKRRGAAGVDAAADVGREFALDQLRDAAVKLLAMKAGWQVRRLLGFGHPVLIFVDEPGLAESAGLASAEGGEDRMGQLLHEMRLQRAALERLAGAGSGDAE